MKIDNQQHYGLTNNQIQVLLTGTFGDGSIQFTKSGKGLFKTSCIYEEYLIFKKNLLGDLGGSKREVVNMGYKKGLIYCVDSSADVRISKLHSIDLESKLEMLDDLGLALWLYDDGSLHRKNGFFNLNTHAFNEEIHYDLFLPYFKNKGLFPKVFKDRKKDGREFSYLYFGRHYGAFEIMKILQKFPIDCYNYKLWCSETIHKWSKLQVQLKSEDKIVTPRKFSNLLDEMIL